MLIGSRALGFYDRSFSRFVKDKTDWDIIGPSDQIINGVEFHDPSLFKNDYVLENFRSGWFIKTPISDDSVCSLRGLAAIKRSHLSLDYNWEKHITQYHFHLKDHLSSFDREFIVEREKLTLKAAKQTNPSLMKSKDAFFEDAVVKKYDHDYLHELVAFYDKPMYTRMQRSEMVYCDPDLWNAFTYEDKIRCVVEECNVIAIERFCVPHQWKPYTKEAYHKAIKKACTTLTSGWFREFAIDNYLEIRSRYDAKVFDKVKLICP